MINGVCQQAISNQLTPGDTSPIPGGDSRLPCEVSCYDNFWPGYCNSTQGGGFGTCDCNCCVVTYTWYQNYQIEEFWNFNITTTYEDGGAQVGTGVIPIYTTDGVFNSYFCNCMPCHAQYNACVSFCHATDHLPGGSSGGRSGWRRGGKIKRRGRR